GTVARSREAGTAIYTTSIDTPISSNQGTRNAAQVPLQASTPARSRRRPRPWNARQGRGRSTRWKAHLLLDPPAPPQPAGPHRNIGTLEQNRGCRPRTFPGNSLPSWFANANPCGDACPRGRRYRAANGLSLQSGSAQQRELANCGAARGADCA